MISPSICEMYSNDRLLKSKDDFVRVKPRQGRGCGCARKKSRKPRPLGVMGTVLRKAGLSPLFALGQIFVPSLNWKPKK